MAYVSIPINLFLSSIVMTSQYVTQVHVVGRILQAFAADLWPGRDESKLCFVQLLVDYTAPSLGVRTISVPLLAIHLQENGWPHEAARLKSRWNELHKDGCVLGIDVDANEGELASLCPSIPRSIFRQFSYASLLFDEFCLDRQELMDAWLHAVNMPPSEVGYIHISEMKVRVHFGIDWLLALVVSAEELTRAIGPFDRFDQWWLSI